MIDFRCNINDARIKAEIDQPLVFGVIAQIHHIVVCHLGHIQLDVQVAWHMKCVRFIIVAIAVFVVPLLLFRLVNTFRHTCVETIKLYNLVFILQMFRRSNKTNHNSATSFSYPLAYRQVFSVHYRWDEEIELNPLSIKSI